ncbi:hypothetical protein, partial [Endozoicomonas sp. SESOKO1]|uniref:hypothetical protein n=1 Tax=Endozoicomonas sp. SESOKO1 TaxID=2828742 RepID=UPI0021496302
MDCINIEGHVCSVPKTPLMEPNVHIEVKWRCFSQGAGIILQVTASDYPHPRPACQAGQQADPGCSTDRPGSSFIGKRISNHQLHTGRTAAPNYGKCIEDAFWKRKPLHGRQVTS